MKNYTKNNFNTNFPEFLNSNLNFTKPEKTPKKEIIKNQNNQKFNTKKIEIFMEAKKKAKKNYEQKFQFLISDNNCEKTLKKVNFFY